MKSAIPVMTIKINWSEYKPNCDHPAQNLLDKIYAKLQQLKIEKPSLVEAMLDGDGCNFVYFGCGSCDAGAARVEAYCNGGGGAEPDYWWCEGC